MNSLLLLIPVALAMGLAGLLAFLWALRSGQFDDMEGAASRILFDDDDPPAAAPGRDGDGRLDSAGAGEIMVSSKEVDHVGH